MAAEVPNNDFRGWNVDLYVMIKQEMETIQREGYDVILIGDFIGHVSNNNERVPGNWDSINSNKYRLRSFVSANNLHLLNVDLSFCSGTFSCSKSNSVMLLDYALVDKGAKSRGNCMILDKLNMMLSHSNHSSILLEVNAGQRKGPVMYNQDRKPI